MRAFVCLVLVMACFQSTPAQVADLWDYVTHPREERAVFSFPLTTRGQVIAYAQSQVAEQVRNLVDDYLPMSAVKLALFSHYPSSNTATQALLASVIPSGVSAENEVRYIAAFKRELQQDYSDTYLAVGLAAGALWDSGERQWWRFNSVGSEPVYQFVNRCYKRAVQVVATMSRLETQLMPALAADADFIRNSALVSLRQQNGFRLQAGQQNLYLTVRSGASRVLFAPLRSVDCRSLHLIQRGTASTATCNIVPQGPVLIKIGSAAEFVQANGALRQFTNAEVGKGIRIIPIDPPTVGVHLTNQQVEVHTTQTFTFDDSFLGQRLRYSVSTSQPSVALVRLSREGHIIDITGVSAGNATITLTASNPAGNAVTQFIVTVVPRSDE